mgnify:CR=1 FL=1
MKAEGVIVLDKTFTSHKKALDAEAAAKAKFAGLNKDQVIRIYHSAALLFWDVYDEYRKHSTKAENTLKADDSRALVLKDKGFIPLDCKLLDYDTTDWRKVLAAVRDDNNKSQATLSNYKSLISSVYEYARNNLNYSSQNPIKGLKLPETKAKPKPSTTFKDDNEKLSLGESKYIPKETFEEFLGHIETMSKGYKTKNGRTNYAVSIKLAWLLKVMWATAMRVGEAQSITYMAAEKLASGKSVFLKDTKNTEEREVKPVAKLRAVCQEILAARTEADLDEHLVFSRPDDKQKPFDYITQLRSVCRHNYKLADRNQLLFGAHDIRHTTITNLIKAGVERETVKTIAGHLTDQAHSIYVHMIDAFNTEDPLEGIDY